MALNSLSADEMVGISQAWVSPDSAAHALLRSLPELALLLPDLESAHTRLQQLAAQPHYARRAECAPLTSRVDALYDLLARGVAGLFTELAMLEDERAEFVALRELLFPEGVSSVMHASRRGQATYAALLRERLTPELRALLKGSSPRGGQLLARIEAWLEAADRLNALEEERGRLEALAASATAQLQAGRLGWIRCVNAVLGVALLAALDEASERLLFGPLRDAELRADLREARQASRSRASGSSLHGVPGGS